jgi:subtilisin family serine protease
VIRAKDGKSAAHADSLLMVEIRTPRRSMLTVLAVTVVIGVPGLARGDDAVPPSEQPSSAITIERVTNEPAIDYAEGQLVVGIADDATRSEVQSALQDAGATVEQSIGAIDTKVVELPAGQVDEGIDSLEQSPAVEYVEPEVVLEATDTIPNDALWQGQWGPQRVRAQKAWDATHGSASVIVAVVDTGVDYSHPDLQGLFVPGYDVVNQDTDPADDQGHGTAVAGVIAARTQNREGQAGMCWACKVMPVKVLDANGSGTTATIAAGIVWAANHGARVINLSLGGAGTTQALQDAINFAVGKGVLVLAAAGNSGTTTKFYPAAYPDVVSVAATMPDDHLYAWSNRGKDWVQVAAPGCDTAPVRGGGYGNFCGTSAATPIASGIGALALSIDPGLAGADIHRALQAAAVRSVSSVHSGRVDAWRTFAALKFIAPIDVRRPRTVGIASSGTTLEARNGRWLGVSSFSYRWERCGENGRGCVRVPGATSTTYQLARADVGATMRVLVTGSNAHGATAKYSAPTAVVTRGAEGASAGTASVPTAESTQSTSGEPPTTDDGSSPPPPPPPSPLDVLPPEIGQTIAEVTEAAGETAPTVVDTAG